MNRRTIALVMSIVLALLLASVPSVSAASPGPRLKAPSLPAAGPFGAEPTGPFDAATGKKQLAADLAAIQRQIDSAGISLPSVSRELKAAGAAAKALHRSLTPAQRAKLRAVLDRNSADLEKLINANMSSQPKAPARGKKPQNVQDFATKLHALMLDLDKGVSSILTADQRQAHRAATAPVAAKITISSPSASSAAAPLTAALSSNCYYAAYYEQIALYYKYYGYWYGYYNYITYGGTYAYYGYLYGNYAYYYGTYAAPLLSLAYMQYQALGRDFSGTGDDGYNYAYLDYYYAYYSQLYAYYSYYYEGRHNYANYNYWYNYYGQYYGYSAQYYAYYYCQ